MTARDDLPDGVHTAAPENEHSEPGSRWLAPAVVGPAVLLLLVDGAAVAMDGRLPDPVAVHFAFTGAPDGSMPLIGVLLLNSAFWLFMQVYTLVLGRGGHGISGWRRPLGLRGRYASAYASFGILAAVVGVVLAANLDKPTWREAHSPPGAVVAVVLAGVIGAAVGAVIAPSGNRLARA